MALHFRTLWTPWRYMQTCSDGRAVRRRMFAWWGKKSPPNLSEVRVGVIQARAKSIVNAAGGASGAIMGASFVPIMMALASAGVQLTWWHGLLMGPLGWPICWVIMRRGTKRVCDMVVTEGLCPCCAAPLVGLTPDTADGCTVCSGCGAAWNVAPVAAGVPAIR